ncbi:flotillin domain-containing protein [Paenibacillus sp. GP183]|uniref:flotillin domain-containing protein n=1 Tax=Paenibacillus sp. GP183 TaxID=1882751 RepID=UPI000B884936|nr:flotillin domain-containing protein [Paenibacillus sp. GP183]
MLRAEGDKAQAILQAEAEAETTIKRGDADALATLAKGKAEAEVIKMAGLSEAEALEKKAEAYKEYTQQALVVEMLRILPELAERIAQPLTNVDKITVISQDGATSGINKITSDITKMMSSVPELTQTLTGYPLMDIIKNVLHPSNKEPVEVMKIESVKN